MAFGDQFNGGSSSASQGGDFGAQFSGQLAPKPKSSGGLLGDISSNIGNIGDMATQAPVGILKFGEDLSHDVLNANNLPNQFMVQGLHDQGINTNTGTAAKDVLTGLSFLNPLTVMQSAQAAITGDQSPIDRANAQAADTEREAQSGQPLLNQVETNFSREMPATTGIAKGYGATAQHVAGNVVAIPTAAYQATTGHLGAAQQDLANSPYAQAFTHGQGPSMLTGDAANLAGLGELAGGALGDIARLATAGEGAEAATAPIADGVAAPIAPAPAGPITTAARNALAPYAPQIQAAEGAIKTPTILANQIAGLPGKVFTAPFTGLDLPAAASSIPGIQSVIDEAGQQTGAHLPGLSDIPAISNFADERGVRADVRHQASNVLPGIGKTTLSPVAQGAVDAEGLLQSPAESQAVNAIGAGVLNPSTVPAIKAAIEAPVPLEAQALHAPTGLPITPVGQPVADANGILHQATTESKQGIPVSEITHQPAQLLPATPETQAARLQSIAPGLSPQALDVADQYFKAKAGQPVVDPELAGRIDQATALTQPASQLMEQRYLDQTGVQKPVPPEWRQENALTATQPRQSLIDKDLANSQSYQDLKAQVDRADNPPVAPDGSFVVHGPAGDPQQLATMKAALDAHVQALKDDPQYAPVGYKPIIDLNQNIVNTVKSQADAYATIDPALAEAHLAIGAQLATTLQDAVDQATPNRHLIYGEQPETPATSGAQGPGVKKLSNEMQRKTKTVDYSIKAQAGKQLVEIAKQNQNMANQQILSQYGQTAEEAGITDPEVLAAEIKRTGMVPVNANGQKIDPSNIQMTATVGPNGEQVPATTLVPKAVYQGLRDSQRGNEFGGLAKTYDKGLGYVKLATMGLRPAYTVGKAVGNVILASVQGASPGSLLGAVPRALELMNHPEVDEVGASVLGHDQFTQNLHDITQEENGVTQNPVEAKAQAVSKLAYKPSQWMENFMHSLVYSAKRDDAEGAAAAADEMVKAGKMTPEQANVIKDSQYSPEEDAKRALQTMGDMDNLSYAERNYVRRIMPFYPWYRHITQLVMRLPVENPYQAAWFLHLGTQFSPNKNTPGLPDYMQAAFPVGGGNYITSGSHGLGVLGRGDEDSSPLLSPGGLLKGLTPPLQWAGAAYGFNAQNGTYLTSSPGTGPRDPEGRPQLGWETPTTDAGYLLNQIPMAKAAYGLFNPTVARYDSNEPIYSAGHTIPSSNQGFLGMPASLASYLTGVGLSHQDLAANAARVAKRQAADAKARAKYQQESEG